MDKQEEHVKQIKPGTIGLVQKLYALLAAAKEKNPRNWNLETIQFSLEGYAEPGYTMPKSGIVAIGNWNRFDIREFEPGIGPKKTGECYLAERLGKIFEKRYGVELEWCDEWDYCCHCAKLIRTVPDHSFWSKNYWQDECDLVCKACVLESFEQDYVDHHTNKPVLMSFAVDLTKYGFQRLEGEYENGHHEGQNDNPRVLLKQLQVGEKDVVFRLEDVGQFDLKFSTWTREGEEE